MKHIQLVEHSPMGHGPLWLGYFVEALIPIVDRLTVTYPDLPAYDSLRSLAVEADKLLLNPVPWTEGRNAWLNVFDKAAKISAPVVIVSHLDPVFNDYKGDLSKHLKARIYGVWFSPVTPNPEDAQFGLRLLTSGKARNRYKQQSLLKRLPRWLSGVWVLDEQHRAWINTRAQQNVWVVPDPWPGHPSHDRTTARRILGLGDSQQLYLHSGVSNPRKGLEDAIQAWQSLEDCPRAVLLRVGETTAEQANHMQGLIDEGRALLINERVTDETLDLYLCACDWVLLPYRFHEASSGLLAGAAATERPVIAPDYGILGRRVKEFGVGLTYPHLSIEALAQVVSQAQGVNAKKFSNGFSSYAKHHNRRQLIEELRKSAGALLRAPGP